MGDDQQHPNQERPRLSPSWLALALNLLSALVAVIGMWTGFHYRIAAVEKLAETTRTEQLRRAEAIYAVASLKDQVLEIREDLKEIKRAVK